MANVTVKVDGIDEVIRNLQKAGVNVRRGMADIAKAGANVIQHEAEQAARANQHDRLADNIVQQPGRRTLTRSDQLVGNDKENAWWAHIIEFGAAAHEIPAAAGSFTHPGHGPYPFFRVALEQAADEAFEAAGRKVHDLVEGGR